MSDCKGWAIAFGTVALMLRTKPLFGVFALRVSINYRLHWRIKVTVSNYTEATLAEIIMKLRATRTEGAGSGMLSMEFVNPDGPAAADAIETLQLELRFIADAAHGAMELARKFFPDYRERICAKPIEPAELAAIHAEFSEALPSAPQEAVRVTVLPTGKVDRANAAKALGRSAKTLSEWKRLGIGPKSQTIGGREFYDWEEVLAHGRGARG